MSSCAPVFVIASNADYKTFNRFLVDVRDWEFGSGDRFAIVETKNAYEMEDQHFKGLAEPVEPGHFTEDNFESPWVGMSMEDVEAFCIDAAKTSERQEPGLFLVLDDKGVEGQTVILAERRLDENDEYTNIFEKVRMPWQGVYGMWCNLDIANMGFDEFCEDDEAGEDGWWEPNDFAKTLGDDMSEENRKLRDELIEKLQEEHKI